MATAFYGTVAIRSRANNQMQVDRFDNADTTLAYSTFTSNGGLTFLDVKFDGFIVDVVTNITSAGTTKDFKLWIDSTDTNIRWVQSASFPTINNRMFNMNPIAVRRGQRIQIQAI